MKKEKYIKGRGAQINPDNPFNSYHSDHKGMLWNDEDEKLVAIKAMKK